MLERHRTASRGADGDQALGRLRHRQTRCPRRDARFAKRLAQLSAATHSPHIGARRRLDGGHQVIARILEEITDPQARLGNDRDGAGRQRLQRRFRILSGQRRADHYRRRALGHQLSEKSDAVHARHLDIERDHIRPFAAHLFDRKEWVGSRANDPDIGIAIENGAHHLAHNRRVIDDHDLDFFSHLSPFRWLVPAGAPGGRKVFHREFRTLHRPMRRRSLPRSTTGARCRARTPSAISPRTRVAPASRKTR